MDRSVILQSKANQSSVHEDMALFSVFKFYLIYKKTLF